MKYANFGMLNVVAHPHPEGTYRDLFERAGRLTDGVNFRGDQFARLSPVSETRNGVFTGRIAVWTEIDKSAKTIQKRTLIEAALSESNVRIPDDLGFNSKIFAFAFHEREHKLFVELVNQEAHSISISSVQKVVLEVLTKVRPDSVDDLSVFVVSRRNAVDQILATEKLAKIEIVLNMPNPDDLDDDKRRLLKELEDMKARQVKTELTRARGQETLILLPRYRVMAELAKDNGYVTATGRDGERKVERSTKDYPEDIQVELLPDESSAIATRRVAENPEQYL